jgi:hypothetical protein
MCQATSLTGTSIVLKTTVDSDSNECRLLLYLSGICKAPPDYTIPLLDIIDLSIGKMIIMLPWKSPLDEVLQFCDCPDNVVSLCLQFVEGVARSQHKPLPKHHTVCLSLNYHSINVPLYVVFQFVNQFLPAQV